jgi:hypothetical protein
MILPRRKPLSATNPTLTDPGANRGLHGKVLTTNRSSHDTAYEYRNNGTLLNSQTMNLCEWPVWALSMLLVQFPKALNFDPIRCDV